MKSIYDSRQRLKFVFIFTAILIAIASLVVSDMLIKDLAQEERQKMEVWAEATRLTASKNTAVDLSLVLKILEGNTTIPVVLCNDKDSIMFVKNINFPENDVEEFKKAKVKELKSKNTIVIDMEDGTFQYVYYDDSIILKRLLIYPYAQLTVEFVFIVIAFLALASTKKAEQNKVWVGLSKETAHQLGTPISSLIAWVEYLRTKDIDPSLLEEMEKDVKRLETIAERFSKIGANLQQKRRFADAGFPAQQHERPGYDTSAEDPVEFRIAAGDPALRSVFHFADVQGLGRAFFPGLSQAPGRSMAGVGRRGEGRFGQGIPLAARGALPVPFGIFHPAMAAYVYGFGFGHGFRRCSGV